MNLLNLTDILILKMSGNILLMAKILIIHLLQKGWTEKLNWIKTVPYKDNYGYFFTSGQNTWHGMEKKEIKRERRCLQVNYVSFVTDWKVKS